MYTRSVTLVAFLIASATASSAAEGTASSVSHPADHVQNLLHQRRLKSAKADKGKKDKAKNSKQGTTGGGTGMGSSQFSGLANVPILGSDTTIVDTATATPTTPTREDEESQDANGSNDDNGSSEPAPNRGDGNGGAAGGIQTGGGSANAGNPFVDCSKSIPTASGPFQTGPCRGSCECDSGCCIPYHAGSTFCAPRGNDGYSTIGGGFMRCL